MASVDINAMLSMVEHMEVVLDRYLAGSARSSETIAHVLDICQQMRAKKFDAETRYWLKEIERRVTEIGNPRAEDNDPSALSKRFLNTHLLQDIHNLRRQILAMERAKRDRLTQTVPSWLTRIGLRCRVLRENHR
ncbi:MAG TPA: hypothetical protein VKA16_12605 [Burkholderiales bacterium]|nr:hypothetical protein [Burkholderiales bacterium]